MSERECLHYAVTQDKITGEVTCNDCNELLIDSIGRIVERRGAKYSDGKMLIVSPPDDSWVRRRFLAENS